MRNARRALVLVFCLGAVGALVFDLALPVSRGRVEDRKEKKEEKKRSEQETALLIDKGRYLATIGVCAACHTPPDVPEKPLARDKIELIKRERVFRTDPDWLNYLDPEGKNHLAGGVPFYVRINSKVNGVVYSQNITPDPDTGLGKWSEDEIVEVLRTGKRKNGEVLFLFPPHTFYKNLAEEDLRALAVYLRNQPPKKHRILARVLPKGITPAAAEGASKKKVAPRGRTPERAAYLMSALVGCRECHSYRTKEGQMMAFAGADLSDPENGVFRLGPDLPLRQTDRGFSTFPYPGYAVLLGGNLSRFGPMGDRNWVTTDRIVRAIRQGISVVPDKYGRDRPLATTMMWQFYAAMPDDDAYAIAEYLKTLKYVPHKVEPNLIYIGEDWEEAFAQVYGEPPSEADAKLFGKTLRKRK